MAHVSASDIRRALARLERLCPDTHLTIVHRWDDVIRSLFGDPGDDIRAECLADIEEAIANVEDPE